MNEEYRYSKFIENLREKLNWSTYMGNLGSPLQQDIDDLFLKIKINRRKEIIKNITK